MYLRRVRALAATGAGPLPWPAVGRACPTTFAVAPPDLAGAARRRWLLDRLEGEVDHLLIRHDFSPVGVPPPALHATCNGAGDAWTQAFPDPAVSASCASGLHALWLARHHLPARVVAVDVVQAHSHQHFEALRVVDAAARPFAPDNPGFIPGEAAVAVEVAAEGPGVPLAGPVLGTDLAALLATLPERPAVVYAQGSGPEPLDRQELLALPPGIPVRMPLAWHGHTLGASGLLALAHAVEAGEGPALVVTRALTGACAAVLVGATRPWPQPVWPYGTPGEAPALHHPQLRRLAAEALAHRPARPPALLAVHLPAPLVPPPEAVLRGVPLPSAIREMTPGFAAALVARCWGFHGPATALVGGMACAMLAAVPDVQVVQVATDGIDWG